MIDNIIHEKARFNKKSLLEKVSGNEKYYFEILGMVRSGIIRSDIEKIAESIQTKRDIPLTRTTAHRAKGSALGSGLEILAELLKSLEQLEPWDWESAERLADVIVEETNLAYELISQEFSHLDSPTTH